MSRCPLCKKQYPAGVTVCAIDGTALSGTADATASLAALRPAPSRSTSGTQALDSGDMLPASKSNSSPEAFALTSYDQEEVTRAAHPEAMAARARDMGPPPPSARTSHILQRTGTAALEEVAGEIRTSQPIHAPAAVAPSPSIATGTASVAPAAHAPPRGRQASTAEPDPWGSPFLDSVPNQPILAEQPEDWIGRTLGSYKLLGVLGKGGMGCVYRAEHTKLGREVALKVLRADYARRKDAVARFFQEARSVNRIRHRNIVDVTDLVELEEGSTFIIMELLDGISLTQLMRTTGAIDTTRALVLMVQICDGLAAAHSVGIVHRDLKPDNIIIVNELSGQDLVKLLDFGVAKLLDQDPDDDIGLKTQVGSVIGTPAYMSPEQAGGMQVDGRADIYSLGAIMYEIFTGQPLFRAKSFGEYVRMHLSEEPTPPRHTPGGSQLDGRIEDVILRCLAKSPDARFQTAQALRSELLSLLAAVETSGEYTRQLTEAHRPLEPTGAAIPIPLQHAPPRPMHVGGSGPVHMSSPNVMVRPSAAIPLAAPPDSGANIPQFYQVAPSRESQPVVPQQMPYGSHPTPMPYGAHPTPMPYGPGMHTPMPYGPPTPMPLGHAPIGRPLGQGSNKGLLIGASLALAATAALLIFLGARKANESPKAVPGATQQGGAEDVATSPPQESDDPDVEHLPPKLDEPAVKPLDEPIKPDQTIPAPEAPKIIVVKITSEPRSKVFPYGAVTAKCETPCDLTIDPGDGGSPTRRDFLLRADGFEDELITINLQSPRNLVSHTLVPLQPDTTNKNTSKTTTKKIRSKSNTGKVEKRTEKKPCKASAHETHNPFAEDEPCE